MKNYNYDNFTYMSEMTRDKSTPDNSDFKRFISACCSELKYKKSTVCFSMDHIDALKKKFNISYTLIDGIYFVELKGAFKNGFKGSKIV